MVDLFNANDGLTGRSGGPYLDQVEARHAEDARAIAEGREPNYETMGGYVGTVYFTAAQLLANAQATATIEPSNAIFSQGNQSVEAADKAVAALVADKDVNLKVAFSAPDVETQAESDAKAQEKIDKADKVKANKPAPKPALKPATKSSYTVKGK